MASKGRIWLPATVTIEERIIRVSTTEETEEFPPHRVSWKGADCFLVTGIGKGSRLKRSFLRFKTSDEASRAVQRMRELGLLLEEPLVQIEEIQVLARFLYSTTELFVVLYTLSIRLVIFGFVISLFSSLLDFSPFIAWGLIILYLSLLSWGIFKKSRRRTTAWLRLEGRSLAVRTESNWTGIVPRKIEWKGEEQILLSGPGSRVELSLPSKEEAIRVASKLRTSFPEIREVRSSS